MPHAPRVHNKVEIKKLHKLGRFPKLRAAGRAAGAAGKSFSRVSTALKRPYGARPAGNAKERALTPKVEDVALEQRTLSSP